MTDRDQNKKYYIDKIKMGALIICVVLCVISAVFAMIWESKTQTLYKFTIQTSAENVIASEENCTNVNVGKNQVTYEKDGVQSIITFPADTYVKTDVYSYEQDVESAYKKNMALVCSLATFIPITMLGVSISAERS